MSKPASAPAAKPRLDLYCGTIVTCRYAIPENLQGADHHDELVGFWERAVAHTVFQHPLLQVGIIKRNSKKPAWIHLDRIDLSQLIEWRILDNPEKYEAMSNIIRQEQTDTKFPGDATQPGWRMVVLQLDTEELLEVMFVWNHTNLDGTGGKIFHETLLQSLNSVREDSSLVLDNHSFKPNATIKTMPPPLTTVGEFSFTAGFAATIIWKELKPPMFKKKLPPHITRTPLSLTPLRTQSRTLSIDDETLKNVLVACREHKTTLTGLLHGISLVSLVNHLKDEPLTAIASATPLNVRRLIPSKPSAYPELEPSTAMANYVSRMGHKFDEVLVSKIRDQAQSATTEAERIATLEDLMWSVSTTVREEIQAKIDLGFKNELCGLMGVVGDYRGYMKDQLNHQRASSWLVTNLGVIDGAKGTSSAEDWTIKRASFSLGANVLGPLFVVSPIAVKGGDLTIGVSWQDQVIDSRIGEAAAADLGTWLRHLGSKP
ncbi:Alcohol acetyltransferase [Neonectria punicea]|uniref:Alcohol acetyltransferase n=1 Tax=Neonectria punicea TaxID=979145 RepID=A0ABR1HN01_9HYPO